MTAEHVTEAREASPDVRDDGPKDRSAPASANVTRAALRGAFSRENLPFWAAVTAVFFVALSVSYVDEDAFISFRVVDNFVHGYGLRWNVDQRVQVFTNPLWVLALIPIHAVVRNVVVASYILSAAASTLAVSLVAWPLRHRPLLLVFGFLLPLFLSQSFTDYTSSGLENPFLFLFIALFATTLARDDAEVPWFELSLFASLSAFTRADSFLLFLPALGFLWLSNLKKARYGQIALGAAPLLALLVFALFYYGTIFPNPKYAKLNAAVGQAQYFKLGILYLIDIARNDTVTFAGLVIGAAAAVYFSLDLLEKKNEPQKTVLEARWVSLLWGAPLYSLYVVYIGGDFMAGRHWAAPFFLVTSTLVLALRDAELKSAPGTLALACCALLGLRFGVQSMTMQHDTVQTREQKRFAIVRNGEIRYQRYNCGFYEALFGSRGPASEHTWSQSGLNERRRAEELAKTHPDVRYVVVEAAAGKKPFFAGPNVFFVDPLAITDPLLARLPDRDGKFVMSGHLERLVPRGYVEARATGSLAQMDPNLAAYYAELRDIIEGPLFDGARLRKIVAFNLGRYDSLLSDYLHGGYLEEKRPPRKPN
jgi:arabinofuranosyltransferase